MELSASFDRHMDLSTASLTSGISHPIAKAHSVRMFSSPVARPSRGPFPGWASTTILIFQCFLAGFRTFSRVSLSFDPTAIMISLNQPERRQITLSIRSVSSTDRKSLFPPIRLPFPPPRIMAEAGIIPHPPKGFSWTSEFTLIQFLKFFFVDQEIEYCHKENAAHHVTEGNWNQIMDETSPRY